MVMPPKKTRITLKELSDHSIGYMYFILPICPCRSSACQSSKVSTSIVFKDWVVLRQKSHEKNVLDILSCKPEAMLIGATCIKHV